MKVACGSQGGLCWKINLIWSYSMRGSWSAYELFNWTSYVDISWNRNYQMSSWTADYKPFYCREISILLFHIKIINLTKIYNKRNKYMSYDTNLMIPDWSKYPPLPWVPMGSLKLITMLAMLLRFQMGLKIEFPNLKAINVHYRRSISSKVISSVTMVPHESRGILEKEKSQ